MNEAVRSTSVANSELRSESRPALMAQLVTRSSVFNGVFSHTLVTADLSCTYLHHKT